MSEAPERIWAAPPTDDPEWESGAGEWDVSEFWSVESKMEYVRADLFAALEAEKAKAEAELATARELIALLEGEQARADRAEALASDLQAKLTDCCLQALATDGQAIEALERAEKAEALLAEQLFTEWDFASSRGQL